MRAIQILALLAAIGLLLWALARRPAGPPPATLAPPDELVKDPVCQTYVVRSRALSRPGPEGPRYFCSDDCARRGA